jgi:hypothetical protein
LATFLREGRGAELARLSPRVERGLSDYNPWMSKMHYGGYLMHVEIFFHSGFAPCINQPSGSILEKNSKTENPIGPHFIARSRKKAVVTPYFFIKY